MEDAKESSGVLLHVENDGPLRATETREGRRGRVQAEASVHSQLVSVCTDATLLLSIFVVLLFFCFVYLFILLILRETL